MHAESIKSIDNNVVEVLSKSVRATEKFKGGAYFLGLKNEMNVSIRILTTLTN